MQFSELWLREFVNIDINSQTLVNQINMVGLEAECITSLTNECRGVIVGEVIECERHVDINKLCILKVNIGRKRLINIVCKCNAKKYRMGMKIAVATTDTILPGNVRIKEKKIYGKLSEGILCSSTDLGISENQNAIIELPVHALIGKDVREYLRLDDNIIDINVTPNRADCLSIIGIARDIAALNQVELRIPKILPIQKTIDNAYLIQINAPEMCPRYLGRIIQEINTTVLTPFWIKERLRCCGVDSVNAVVDIANYVFLELGQPVYLFDTNCIEGGIIVRMSKEKENIVLKNKNKIIKLTDDILVVSDHKKILSIGGVFNSEYFDINENTKSIFIECAFFSPQAVIKSVRRYNLYNRVAKCYEHGVDFHLQYQTIERVTDLLVKVCGGKVGPIVDVTNTAYLPQYKTITLHRQKLDDLIGYYISDFHVEDILYRLGFKIIKKKNYWEIISPSWRFDITIEEDIVEEIIRIYGYDNIPHKPFFIKTVLETRSCHEFSTFALQRVKTLLIDKGYQEVITYSFVNPKIQNLIHPNKAALALSSPISAEMSVMRLSLWTGLIETIAYNQNRQQNRIRIFETGLRFIPDDKAELGIRQEFVLSGAITGSRYEEHWDLQTDIVDFYDMKGDVESIFDLTDRLSEVKFCFETMQALHPGQSSAIYLGVKRIGFIGVIHPMLEYKLCLNQRTVVFELAWDDIPRRIIPQLKEISRFPSNRRDISFIVSENVLFEDILTECKKINTYQVVDIRLFDVYRGKNVQKGFKSLAISLIIQSTQRTLTEHEITATVSKYVEVLKKQFKASLRDEI